MSEVNLHDETITEEEREELKQFSGESPSALILFAALKVGPNKKRVSKITGIPRSSLEPYWMNFKDNGIFTKTKVWLDTIDKNGEHNDELINVAFTLACAVGDGYLERDKQ